MHGPEDYNEKSSLLGDQPSQREIAARLRAASILSDDGHPDLAWPGDTRSTHTGVWGGPQLSQGGRGLRPRSRTSSSCQVVLAECCSAASVMYLLIIAGLVSIGLFLHIEFVQAPLYVRKIAIIGAGPAGASAAYNVKKLAQEEGIFVDITLYEKSDYIGGRATCRVNYNSEEGDDYYAVQIAAKGFHASDKNLVDTVDELRLTPVMLDGKEDTDLSGRSGDRWGVFDGSGIIYRQSHPTNFLTGWWWSFKLFFFYGYSPKNTRNTITNTLSKLKRIYSPRFFPFESLNTVILELELTEETSLTGSELLDKNGVGIPFQKDLVNAWTRRDFAQNLGQISGLAAMTAPDDGGDMTVEGGHWKLFEEMVRASEAEVMLNTTVFGMRQMEWGGWVVAAQKASEGDDPQDGDYQEFDSVILAAPYQFSNLEIKGGQLAYVPDELEYAPLHVTLFRSPRKLSREYFHHNGDIPETILTTLGGDEFSSLSGMVGLEGVGRVGFYSITSVKRLAKLDAMGVIVEEFLYKIVSPEKIKDDMIYQLLGASSEENDVISWLYRHEWSSAYPYIYPRTEFAELKLDENFWYTGGIEELSSSMELSSLMGANVAKLVVDGWVREGRFGKRPDRRFEEGEEGEETLFPETIWSYLRSQYEGTWSEDHRSDNQGE